MNDYVFWHAVILRPSCLLTDHGWTRGPTLTKCDPLCPSAAAAQDPGKTLATSTLYMHEFHHHEIWFGGACEKEKLISCQLRIAGGQIRTSSVPKLVQLLSILNQSKCWWRQWPEAEHRTFPKRIVSDWTFWTLGLSFFVLFCFFQFLPVVLGFLYFTLVA